MSEVQLADVLSALSDLLGELVDGAPESGGYVLNPRDPGLLKSLDRASASDASAVSPGAATTIAAHVDHVRYGISLFNRWAGGEKNPFATADWSESWKRTTVSDSEWASLRERLGHEVHTWATAMKAAQPTYVGPSFSSGGRVNEMALKGVLASVAHLAYHLGAIRQMDQRIRGPKEEKVP